MAKRDIVDALKVITAETISLTSAPADFVGTGVNVQGFSRGLMYSVEPSRAIVTGDDITYKFQSSSDDGVADAYADLPSAAILPTWNTGNIIEEPIAGIQQGIGAACSGELYVRPVFSSTALTANVDLVITGILEADQKPYAGWSSTPPPADDLP